MLAKAAALFLAGAAWGEPSAGFEEAGRLFVQNFSVEDYDAHPQNHSVVQGPNDLIYVANGSGVLEYDGVSWRPIEVPKSELALSLGVGPDGRIFVGGRGELGYLAPDSQGRMSYLSLVDRLEPQDRDFGEVWNIASTSQAVYFHTRQRLLGFDGEKFTIWPAETRFTLCAVLDDSFYTRQPRVGLMRLEQGALVLAPGGAFFRDKTIVALVPSGEHSHLVITRKSGLFECPTRPRAGQGCAAVHPSLGRRVTEASPYHAAAAPGGLVAIATQHSGVLLLDRSGRLLRIVDEETGLQSNFARYAYADRQGGLWLALAYGLARIQTDPSLSFWDKKSNDMGPVVDIVRHRGEIYAASLFGLHRLARGENGAASRFLTEPGEFGSCWSLLSTPQGLLAGCQHGLFNLDRGERIGPEGLISQVFRSRKDPTSLYLGLGNGIGRLRLRDGRWSDFERIAGNEARIANFIVEDSDGNLWFSGVTGLQRLEPAASAGTEPKLTAYGVDEGLPEGVAELLIIDGELRVKSGPEFLRLGDSGRLEKDSTLAAKLAGGPSEIDTLREGRDGRLWVVANEASSVAVPSDDGHYRWQPIGLRRAPIRDVYTMRLEPGGPLWVSSTLARLIRYVPGEPLGLDADYPVWIRRVTTPAGGVLGGEAEGDSTRWPYGGHAIRFEYAAPRFDAPERTRYRSRLDGQDTGWSEWSAESHRDFMNLWEGSYVFRVQARDVYGTLSQERSFAFHILPPWYRTWWAYVLYALALALALAAFIRSQQRKVERERAVVVQLREVDKLKDEFLAATSHELRTPLYGMTGLAESLAGGARGEPPVAMRKDLEMIAASGRRLSSLVDDILDFSKMRRASLALERRPVELHALADVVLTLSRPLAADKNLELSNRVPTDLPPALADENRVQQILHNLVGNAIKFTESGRVEVRARRKDDALKVEVVDTGLGVADRDKELIFNAFEQADGAVDRRFGGTGLGLAVSRQLVELHGGELWLDSSSPEGSTFAFTLPVTSEEATAERLGATAGGPNDSSPTGRDAPIAVLEAERPLPDGAAQKRTGVDAAGGESRAGSRKPDGGARILVVDDEPVNRQVLVNQLESVGYHIAAVADGPQALRRIEEQPFDLVLLDVMMPRMSGYEVCRALRERHPAQDLPVLFLTARTRIEDQITGLGEGANDYLTKPVSRDALLARVRTHVELLKAYRKQLAGLVPICAECKKIRDDEGYWEHIENFLASRSDLVFSHGMCPSCTDSFIARIEAEKAAELA